MSDFDVPDSDVSNRIMVNLEGLNMNNLEVGELRIKGLDGCFLNDYFGGYLLAAVGINRNNGIYPIAYAAVESENQASWLWFLELLAWGLEIVISYKISFMSDKQRGLVEAISMLFPNAKTMHYVKHLYANFKKVILEAREKSIMSMMKTIRTKIMLLIVKKKDETEKIKGILCPKIKKKLDAGGDRYQVECGLGNQHVVNLVENSCFCKNWDLTGISCMHAVAVIHQKDEYPKTFVRRKESDEPQTTEMLTKRGVEMRCSKYKKLSHNKRSCRGEVGQNIPVKRHKVGAHNQVVAPTQ
ncbi:hypothetical protein Golob_025938 [Gossypium lobatum]|uniref:SWIM-type domain-containing protein n=1 Tax=Gossypium lobatum TaxID=34289 RepID=A0A7J8LU12_9ROSI|nr:hypothetical protein [Gossypium lobatum]